jgi:hypothetical protein
MTSTPTVVRCRGRATIYVDHPTALDAAAARRLAAELLSAAGLAEPVERPAPSWPSWDR